VVKLDTQAIRNRDAHPLSCNKIFFMAETLKLNNLAVLIRTKQADSTIRKNKIIGEPTESRKGNKVLHHRIVDESF
jgi:hypothetical protein